MAKKIRIITNAIIFPSGAWVRDATPNPGLPAGYYALSGDAVSTITGSIEITGNQFFQLYDASDVYIGDYALGQLDLPQGLSVTSIAQGPGASGHDGIPQGNAGGGLTTYPVLTSGGASVTSWNAGILAISNMGFTYVPATMSYWFLNGFWKLTINVSIPAGDTGLRVICASQTGAAIKAISPNIVIPTELDNTPLMMYEGIWDADASLCPVIGPLTNVQIVDPVTGEFSWTYPVGVTSVVIKLSRDNFDDVYDVVSSPTTNYIPTDMYGDVEVTITPVSEFPVCYGPESTLSLAITTPFVYTMGSSGITAGIFLGGSAPLQFIGNPSGIYTLVPGKAYDTLYERIPTVTSQDVKIPDPFIKTAYFGE